MRHLMDVVPDVGAHGVSRQRLEGRGADEAQCGLGRHDPDGMARVSELTDDCGRLVGGDATGDADDDPLAVRTHVVCPPALRAGGAPTSPKRLIATWP